MFDTLTATMIFGALLLSGMLKGATGVGLQTVALALLTIITNLPNAISLMLLPSLVTNIWQACVGKEIRTILIRLWPLFLTATMTAWIGAKALKSVDLTFLSALLGVILITYAAFNLSGIRFEVKTKHEWWIAPLIGSVNGILSGMTGIFVVPGVFYFQAIGLRRDTLIQSMGILFTALTLVLTFSLQRNGIFTIELAVWSVMAVVPAILGMIMGQLIRHRVSEAVFSKFFFVCLILLGTFITFNAF